MLVIKKHVEHCSNKILLEVDNIVVKFWCIVGAECKSAGIAARTLANIADVLGAMSHGAGGLRSGPACNSQWNSAFQLLEVCSKKALRLCRLKLIDSRCKSFCNTVRLKFHLARLDSTHSTLSSQSRRACRARRAVLFQHGGRRTILYKFSRFYALAYTNPICFIK